MTDDIPGKTPAKPSAFSMSSSIGSPPTASSLPSPSRDEDGYIFVPIPSLLPVSLAIASWSPKERFSLDEITVQVHTVNLITKFN